MIGLSCNTLGSHEKWIQDINETQNCKVEFPIIADADRQVAMAYGMLDYQDPSNVDKSGMSPLLLGYTCGYRLHVVPK